MLPKQWLVLAALVVSPFAATAQQENRSFDPSDANAPTRAVVYESVFQAYRASTAEEQTPDTIWRAANDEMGKLGGHAGHMKDNMEQSAATAKMTPVPDNQDHPADDTHLHQRGRQ